MKIYTRGGDRGETSLGSGERVSKSAKQVEAYGTVDELNSLIGTVVASIGDSAPETVSFLRGIQSDLLHVGAWVARTPGSGSLEGLRGIPAARIADLEGEMDRLDKELPPLTSFILPGGHPAAAGVHVARTVCRRAERRMVDLAASSDSAGHLRDVLGYLNRLADYLFVLARHLNRINDVPDAVWNPI